MFASLPYLDLFIIIEGNNNEIKRIYFNKDNIIERYDMNSEVAKAKQQINEYLLGKRKKFNLNLFFNTTDFNFKVYLALMNIAYAHTKSYSQIACEIKHENACRAVGNANNKNPFVIVVPCHRVIGKNNSLVGFAPGIKYKKALLELEKNNL